MKRETKTTPCTTLIEGAIWPQTAAKRPSAGYSSARNIAKERWSAIRFRIYALAACVLSAAALSPCAFASEVSPDPGFPEGPGFSAGFGDYLEGVLAFTFFDVEGSIVTTTNFEIVSDLAFSEGLAGCCGPSGCVPFYEDLTQCPDCGSSVTGIDPFFRDVSFIVIPDWDACEVDGLNLGADAVGKEPPLFPDVSYIHSYLADGVNNSYMGTPGDACLDDVEHLSGWAQGDLLQVFDLSGTSSWKLTYCFAFRFGFAAWGPTEYRWPFAMQIAPQIGDFVSYVRRINHVNIAQGQSTTRRTGVVRIRKDLQWVTNPVGVPLPMGAPDGAGVLDSVEFTFQRSVPGEDQLLEEWTGSQQFTINSTGFPGVDLSLAPMAYEGDESYGDANEDGEIRPDDVGALLQYINGGGEYRADFDFNQDGDLTQTDVVTLNYLMGVPGFRSILLGDVNGDWQIDAADLDAIMMQIGSGWGDAFFSPQADVDGDGRISNADQTLLDAYVNG